MDMACVPAQRPLHEVIIHLVRKRGEVIGIAHLKADDGDQVRKLRHGAPLDLFRLPDGIAFPQALDGDALRLQLFIQGFELCDRHGTVLVPLIVNDPQGKDLILVLLDKRMEGLEDAVCIRLLVGIIPGKEHRVDIHGIDDLLMAAAHILDVIANIRMIEGLHGLLDQRLFCLIHAALLVLSRLMIVGQIDTGFRGYDIWVKSIQQPLGDVPGAAADGAAEFGALPVGHLAVEPDHTVCKGCEGVLILCTHGHIQHQFLHADGGLALQRAGLGLFGFRDANGVHDHKMILVLRGGRRHLLQIVLAEGAGAAPLHLLKIILAADVAHKDQALDGLHIRPRGDHVNGNGNTGIIIVAEGAENGLRTIRLTGDLLAELIALAKLLPDDLNDIIRMAVGLGEDQRLGHFAAMREKLREQVVPERSDHGTDLAGIHNVPIQLCRGIDQVFVHLFPALCAGQAVPILDLLLQDHRTVFRNIGLNEEDILTDIDTINNGLLTGILADHVLVEKGKGTLVWRSGQANDEGVEIFQHLVPNVVDRPMAFIDDDAVEKLRGNLFVIDDLFCGLCVGSGLLEEGFFLCGFIHFLTLQDGVHPLNGADADLDVIGDIGAVQAANTVKLGKGAVVVIRRIGKEFPLRLLAQ